MRLASRWARAKAAVVGASLLTPIPGKYFLRQADHRSPEISSEVELQEQLSWATA